MNWKNKTTKQQPFTVSSAYKIELLLAHDITNFYSMFDDTTPIKVIQYLSSINVTDYDVIRNMFEHATIEDKEDTNAIVSYMLYPDEYFIYRG